MSVVLFPPRARVFYSLEVAKLKRDAGTGANASVTAAEEAPVKEEAGLSPPDWDTPVARELRGKIRTLEREARKREAVLKVGGNHGKLVVEGGGGMTAALLVRD